MGRDGLWWPDLSDHWLSCAGCWQYLPERLMYGILFWHLWTSSGCFHPRTFFLINWLGKLPWTSCESDLHTKLWLISMVIPSLATGSPCAVWGRRWTTCLLYGVPLLSLLFKWVLLCIFVIVERNVLVISCFYSYFYTLPKFHLLLFFLDIFHSEITVCTEYVVRLYSIDVVSTLSYQHIQATHTEHAIDIY